MTVEGWWSNLTIPICLSVHMSVCFLDGGVLGENRADVFLPHGQRFVRRDIQKPARQAPSQPEVSQWRNGETHDRETKTEVKCAFAPCSFLLSYWCCCDIRFCSTKSAPRTLLFQQEKFKTHICTYAHGTSTMAMSANANDHVMWCYAVPSPLRHTILADTTQRTLLQPRHISPHPIHTAFFSTPDWLTLTLSPPFAGSPQVWCTVYFKDGRHVERSEHRNGHL